MSKDKKAKPARNLLLSEYQGILSTISVDVAGYPFGSVVPYCLNQSGEPIILISRIAQHTKNILSDSKVSLIATERGADDQQTVGRITYIGNAQRMDNEDEANIQRYYNFFPQSRDYHKIHDFDFYYIKPVKIRYIGGFGEIYWIEKEEFLLSNPFNFNEEKSMIEHMNRDHADALVHYCLLNNISHKKNLSPVMVGIDSEGFHIRIGGRIHRINFLEPVTTSMQVREAMVEMARASA